MIYTRIDTYSVILYSCSVRNLLDHLGVPTDNLDTVNRGGYKKHDVKIGDTFVWCTSGIRIECKLDEYDLHEDSTSIFDIQWSWLRLHIYGEGIDYLQDLNSDDSTWNLSILLSQPDYWDPISEFHKVTRCDFAFDYINYEGNEFERLRKIIASADFDDKLSDKGRLYTGTKSGISYEYRGGKQRTIYLGCSDRLLRIYDKKFQMTDSAGNFDTSSLPKIVWDEEITVDSWYRVELQVRENFAERYLMSCQGDFRYIMGEIAAFFDVRTNDGKRIAPLHKIFLWTQRTPIIQNAYSKKPQDEVTVSSSWVCSTALSHIVELIGILGWQGFRDMLNESIKRKRDLPLVRRHAYISKVNNELSLMAQQRGKTFDVNGNIGDLIKMDDGLFYLAPFPISSIPSGPYVKGGKNEK